MQQFDYLVIGSGSAGLSFALRVCESGSVALITKKERTDSNTNWAQGGIAGVMGPDDDMELHVQDTLIAGAGLCNEEAVRVLVNEGPDSIRELISFGADFNRTPEGDLSLGREGGHSRRRIIHTADLTGKEVEHTLVEAVRRHSNITVLEHHYAVDLVVQDGRCCGAYVLDEATGEVSPYVARATLLATGGAGQVYRFTTNPPIATGDGVAVAWRAGAEIANMEFIQFHPTSLFHPDAKSFLISEAVRGEGGILRRKDGTAFMVEYDPERKDLAPRDIVARAIDSEIKKTGDECVYLDVTHLSPEAIKDHFPTIYARCLSFGIDITTDWIPVVPAAHYSCGGVTTDLVGRTSIARLYACGEVASTGVHGANRLASNSLLEALVFAKRAAADAMERTPAWDDCAPVPSFDSGRKRTEPVDPHQLRSLRHRVQTVMQKYVGIVRTDARLQKASDAIAVLRAEADPLFSRLILTDELLELRNMLTVAGLIIYCAQQRHESRGLNFNTDYPETLESERHDTKVRKDASVSRL
ncbi:L-aspartate oxidase [Capsulimonas corticalis]|uniref:L-aspartate oxidase n=1 Tax=Capsulimonas corticalis TaxID=2219043 RepID=A0A402CU13_9BACT|nr:L-aspartate oxidase [Capsulimonas corticalis]BDI28823.1 L-aspartate oxidase [Capsulimonas corticalis]